MVQHLHPLNCVSVSFQSCNLSKSQMAIFDKILPWICCFLHNSTVTFHFSLYIFKLHRYQPQMKSAANENGDSMYHIGLTEVMLTFNLLNVQPHVSHTMLCKKFHLAVTVVIASTNLEQQLACMWCTSRADFHEFGGEYIICEYMYCKATAFIFLEHFGYWMTVACCWPCAASFVESYITSHVSYQVTPPSAGDWLCCLLVDRLLYCCCMLALLIIFQDCLTVLDNSLPKHLKLKFGNIARMRRAPSRQPALRRAYEWRD